MNTKMEKLTEMTWQNMTIDADDEHVLVKVAFPKSVTEWFTEDDLIHFVANLIPLCDWDEEGIFRHKNDESEYIFVTLWWSAEDEPCEPYLRELHDKALLAAQSKDKELQDLAAQVRESAMHDEIDGIRTVKVVLPESAFESFCCQECLFDFVQQQFSDEVFNAHDIQFVDGMITVSLFLFNERETEKAA